MYYMCITHVSATHVIHLYFYTCNTHKNTTFNLLYSQTYRTTKPHTFHIRFMQKDILSIKTVPLIIFFLKRHVFLTVGMTSVV